MTYDPASTRAVRASPPRERGRSPPRGTPTDHLLFAAPVAEVPASVEVSHYKELPRGRDHRHRVVVERDDEEVEEGIEPLPQYLKHDIDAQKRFRVAVWAHTHSIVEGGGYINRHGQRVAIKMPTEAVTRVKTFCPPPRLPIASASARSNRGAANAKVLVVNGDCIDVATFLVRKLNYSPLMMDAASREHFGGGYKNGARAQEEELCRRSTLPFHVDPTLGIQRKRDFYPLAPTDALYVPDVTFFRLGAVAGYRVMDAPIRCAVGAVAAHNRPRIEIDGKMSAEAASDTFKMICSFLRAAIEMGHDSVVCVALGCGAFRNPASHVACLFVEAIAETGALASLQLIVFAVLEDHNSRHEANPDGNFAPFAHTMEHCFSAEVIEDGLSEGWAPEELVEVAGVPPPRVWAGSAAVEARHQRRGSTPGAHVSRHYPREHLTPCWYGAACRHQHHAEHTAKYSHPSRPSLVPTATTTTSWSGAVSQRR